MIELERLRVRVLASVATGMALACAARVVPDDAASSGDGSDDGGPPPPSTTSGSMDASAGGNTAPATSGVPDPWGSGGPADDPRFDVAFPDTQWSPPDPSEPVPPPDECVHAGGEGFICEVEPEPPAMVSYYCVALPEGGNCDGLDPEAVVADAQACLPPLGGACGGGFTDIVCGPDPGVTDACCYQLEYYERQICPGRPFTVGGRERLAPVRAESGWAHALAPRVCALDHRERRGLSAAWAECASFEHASVASFARFTFQLLSCGAPAALIEAAQVALAEELEHARLFFALASAYAGHDLGPGALPVAGCLDGIDDLATVAAAAVREGCIAETVSALQIAVAAERATDPVVVAALRRVADEELRHAELAWTFVAWVWARASGRERSEIRAAFRHPARAVPRGPHLAPGIDAAVFEAHGLLPAPVQRELAERALRHVVTPSAEALLLGPRSASSGVGARPIDRLRSRG